ncbi:uncharacterized protein LOC127637930 isoform X6 [Xyrauchen texanus]|uniref:uncharacterized protein LOC127637930 isoform X6 n=1 Tax=Xyrauchen texanus TaxID=154827 RepID=UPI002242B45B|nr:uncharacterized protein LOC127637930 isoform X6 [Xyrauchen texanus]
MSMAAVRRVVKKVQASRTLPESRCVVDCKRQQWKRSRSLSQTKWMQLKCHCFYTKRITEGMSLKFLTLLRMWSICTVLLSFKVISDFLEGMWRALDKGCWMSNHWIGTLRQSSNRRKTLRQSSNRRETLRQ